MSGCLWRGNWIGTSLTQPNRKCSRKRSAGVLGFHTQAGRIGRNPLRHPIVNTLRTNTKKDMAVYAVRDAVGRLENVQSLATPWVNGLKVHAAALPLAEFTGTIGNLRGARFGRDSAWRAMACFGALDEFRHTQIPSYRCTNWFAGTLSSAGLTSSITPTTGSPSRPEDTVQIPTNLGEMRAPPFAIRPMSPPKNLAVKSS
jgi:hypothetical protein